MKSGCGALPASLWLCAGTERIFDFRVIKYSPAPVGEDKMATRDLVLCFALSGLARDRHRSNNACARELDADRSAGPNHHWPRDVHAD
jgi:hypothetical protein